jgi:uncharacterized protein
MSIITQNVFFLQINRDFLVYSPLNGISAILNQRGFLELIEQMHLIQQNNGNPKSKLFELTDDILNTPIANILRKTGKPNLEYLGLITTRACNGACNYCDFGSDKYSNETMPYDLIVKVVDWYINQMLEIKRNIVEVHFFGGEPMVAQDVMEIAIHRTRLLASQKGLITYFQISTNGQYNSKRARWLGNYFNSVILSFDGVKGIQNAHRPLKNNKASFENAFNTAKIIGESSAELSIRCCISKLNIDKMQESTHWFCQNFRLSALNFEILTSTDMSRKAGLLPPDPVEFAIQYQKSKEIAKSYGVEVVYASDITKQPQVTSCPVGKDAAIISPEGRISNCYLLSEKWQEVGLDLDFGFVNSSENVQIDQNKLDAIRKMVEDKPHCEKCFCQWSCSGGCHVGNIVPVSLLKYNDFCLQTRIISAFTLLADLGFNSRIDGLLETPKELIKLATQKTDRVIDFKE